MASESRPAWRRVATAIARRVRPTPAAPDRAAAARASILESGLFDVDYYAAQTGSRFESLTDAVADYVESGEKRGLAPHPLIEPEWLQRSFVKRRAQGFANWLDTGREAAPHPLLKAGESLEGHEELRAAAFAWAREVAAGGPAPDPIDWLAAAGKERDSTVVSLLIPVYQDWKLTIEAIASALRTSDDTELVLIDNGSRRSVGAIIQAIYGREPRVVYRRVPVNTNFATGSNLALVASRGERVIFMNNDTEPQPGWEEPLLAALDDPAVRGAQPLLLYPDRTIQSAGTLLHGPRALPTHALVGHPREDAQHGDVDGLEAVTAAFLAVRASEVIALEGFDPAYVNGQEDVDLCLRLVERFGGAFRVVTDAVVVHKESQSPGRFAAVDANRTLFIQRWGERLPVSSLDVVERAGFTARVETKQQFDGYRSVTHVLTRPPRVVDGAPVLRWAIKNPAHADARGDAWGDTFFADDLARALRGIGHEVVVDRREAHNRPSGHLDDVTIALRGLHRIAPTPGAVNVLWIISHPELIEDGELDDFDLVFAASATWGAERGIRPLLQATDPQRFHPGPPSADLASDVLFVGRPRGGVFRPVVRDALAAGADLALYGDTWERFIDPSLVRAHHLDNARLPDAYRSARIVLNDHWSDMAELGFVSNRLFDAAATGARIVTDDVVGLDSYFGGLARAYSSVDELRMLLSPATQWPDAESRAAIAARVATEHSFAARARVLVDEVLALRARQSG